MKKSYLFGRELALKRRTFVSIFTLAILLFSCVSLFSAPYIGKQIFNYTQPDGKVIQVKLYGDEFFVYQETLDGHVIIEDPQTKFWCYAVLSDTGTEFISSKVPVSGGKLKLQALQAANKSFKSKLRLPINTIMKKVVARQKILRTDAKGRTLSPAGKLLGNQMPATPGFAPPSSPTTGNRVGLCVIVEFPDQAGTITQAQVDAFCNDPEYTEFSNATSVYGYFDIQSNGKLQYNNIVTAYVMADNNKTYYDDNSTNSWGNSKAQTLVTEVLGKLKAQGFDFSRLSVDGSNYITSLNIYYAGSVTSSWSQGLWPHKWAIPTFDCGGGIRAYSYQISDMKSELKIGTFCHENGHMTCGFPDLYSYNGNPAKFNYYGLMASGSYGGSGKRPTNVSAYLKAAAGWADIIDVTSASHLRGSVQVDRNHFYRYKNPSDPEEYYILEVRNNTGYEGTSAPGQGLVMYHCLESGSNTYSTLSGSYDTPYECLVIEANRSTSNWYLSPDPYSSAPFSSAGTDNATDATTPNISFWSGSGHNTASNLEVHTISAAGDTMTFIIGNGAVAGLPEIGLTASSFTPTCDFGTDADSQEFSIWNEGGGTLNYTVADDVAWLTCSVSAGTASTESDEVTITYDTDALGAGTYNGTITVTNTDDSATQTIAVQLTVNNQGTIALSPTSLSPSCNQGDDATQQSFEISNSGGGTISYTISDNATWLACTPTSGTVKAETDSIYVNYTTNGLTTGTYAGVITVSDPSASNNPREINVSLNVNGTGYNLTVNSGTGDGNFAEGATPAIIADAAPAGQVFDAWTGDVANVADVNSATTTVTMPAADVTVTATYKTAPLLTVEVNGVDQDLPILSYGGDQDAGGTATIENDGASVHFSGNTWKMIDLTNVNITADTVIEFDFTSTVEGEIHAIGFDTDTEIDIDLSFQLYGTADWGIADFNDYDATAPATKHYVIPVGQSFTGSYQYLTFTSDHDDITGAEADSVYSNIRIYENTGTTYLLTVNSGTGDGNYAEAATPTITADAAPTGQEFDAWTGDIANVADVNAATTTVTMPAAAVTVTATYKVLTYTVTVNAGTNGSVTPAGANTVDHGDDLIISATADAGYHFVQWNDGNTVTPRTLTNITADATYAAEFAADAPGTYALTVNSGTGDGTYAEGATPAITADAAPAGQEFDAWTGDTANVADVNAATTTVTMPAAAVTVTATYKTLTYTVTVSAGANGSVTPAGANTVDHGDDLVISATADAGYHFVQWNDGNTVTPRTLTNITANATYTAEFAEDAPGTYALTVNSGIGDGIYAEGATPTITADAAPAGQVFDAWTGDVANVADVNSATTTVTMPAAAVTVTATYKATTNLLTVEINGVDQFLPVSIFDEGTQGSDGSAVVEDAGATLHLTGNTWRKVDLTNVTITADTVIEFDFTSTSEGEIHGLGFGNTDTTGDYETTVFQLYGSQTWGITTYKDYAATAPATKHYTIPVGQAYTGNYRYLMFPNDDDDNEVGEGKYSNIRIYENTGTTYSLTVNNGTGSGDYAEAATPSITADAAPAGQVFDAWTGDVANVADVNAATTTVTMPAAAVTVTATYKAAPVASGIYVHSFVDDATVNSGYTVTKGDSSILSDVSTGEASSITVTIPALNSGSGDSYPVNPSDGYTEFGTYLSTCNGFRSVASTNPFDIDITGLDPAKAYTVTLWGARAGGNSRVTRYTLQNADSSDFSGTATAAHSSGGTVNAPNSCDINAGSNEDRGDVAKWTDIMPGATSMKINASYVSGTAYIYINMIKIEEYDPAGGDTYSLTVNNGTGDGDYAEASTPTITADAAPAGQEFDAWTGDVANVADVNAATTTVTMPAAAVTVTATYKALTYTVTVAAGANGSVTPAGANTVNHGDDLVISATADGGYHFVQWNDGNTVTPRTLTNITADATYTAEFAEDAPGTYALTVNSGTGDGTYAAGATPTITADAAPAGQEFDAWTGDVANVADVNAATTTVTMPAVAVTVTATYKTATYTITVNAGANGSVTPAGANIVDHADDLVISATADAGYHFVQWNDGNTVAPRTLTNITADATYTAEFAEDAATTYALTVNSGTGGGNYAEGATPAITADAAPAGQEFDAWTGDVANVADVNAATTSVTMPAAAVTVTATYKALTYTVTVTAGANGSVTPAGANIVDHADDLVISATADAGYHFVQWNDGNTVTPRTLTNITADATYTAEFAEDAPGTYALTVNSGTGDGTYAEGATPAITADVAPAGQEFDVWTGDVANVADVNSATTTVTMPAAAVTVTATYKTATYTVTVNAGANGSVTPAGANTVDHGDDLVISATADAGYHFVQWNDNNTVTPRTLTNITAGAAYTAEFAAGTYVLTVNSGIGSGTYEEGATPTITADAAPAGQAFDVWTGDVANVADVNAASTTVTMPAAAVTVTATYKAIPAGELLVEVYGVNQSSEVLSYGGSSQDVGGTAVVEDSGLSLHLTGNTWKMVDLSNVTITANSVIEFDFTGPSQGEIHGIGFDNNTSIESNRSFKVYGTQNNWGIQTYSDYASTAPATKHYSIPVGLYYTGNYKYLFFINDHDAGTTGEGFFSNVRIVSNAAEANITYGSVITTDAKSIPQMDVEFSRNPLIYGTYTDPVTKTVRSVNARSISKITATAQNDKFKCEWIRNICLYDKRALLKDNKAGITTSEWLLANPIEAVTCQLSARVSKSDKTKLNTPLKTLQIMPPEVTSIETGAGKYASNGIHKGSVITVKGKYFGNKLPTAGLEYVDAQGAVKLIRLKVLPVYKFANTRGIAKKSCMDPMTGISEIQIAMPPRSMHFTVTDYSLIICNKVGIALDSTTGRVPVLSFPYASDNTAPVANDDYETIQFGLSRYQFDVLANDVDAEADNLSLSLARTSEKGGKISVRSGKISYTLPKDITDLPFVDTFTYDITDGYAKGDSATVTVIMNAITVDPIRHWDGTLLGTRTVQPSSRIIITGSNFGVKVPTVTMAVENGKTLKLKVISKPKYADLTGRACRSYTGIEGDSMLMVELPKKAWDGYTDSQEYIINVANKFDTTGAYETVITSAGNTAPTANNDTIDIYSGKKCFYLDVLANNGNGLDADAESDKLTIVLPSRKTSCGAKVTVNKASNTIRYIRAKGLFCSFSDTFEYSLMDTSGAVSETVTVTVNGNLNP